MSTSNIHRRLTLFLQFIMLLGFAGAIWEQQWLNAAIIAGIVIITLYPILLSRRFDVTLPAEIQLFTIAFVFASLFLGEVHNYYDRFWWWDIALHASSGLLLGIIGFLLVYVLNENEKIHLHMQPGFLAFFAFMFAVGMGALWEIFEFSMDQILGTNMQKPMFGDYSGLTDTMYDLILDALGGLIMAIIGYLYLKRKDPQSFLGIWITKFNSSNPRFFKSSNKAAGEAESHQSDHL